MVYEGALPSYSVAEVQAVLRLILIFRTEIITADKQNNSFKKSQNKLSQAS
jgi:hypothetical protein